jgi:hypothetical protein
MGFGRDRARQSFEGTLSEAHADNAMPSFFRMNWRMTHVTGSAIEAKAAFSAPGNLSAHDDYDESSIAHRLTAAATSWRCCLSHSSSRWRALITRT